MKRCEFPEMELQLYQWFLKQREKHVPINGELLKSRALMLHNKLYVEKSFNASEGWLSKFKKRHGIRLLTISGEKLSTQPELVAPFKKTLHSKINTMQLSNA